MSAADKLGGAGNLGRNTELKSGAPSKEIKIDSPKKPDKSAFEATQKQNRQFKSSTQSQNKLSQSADTSNPMNQSSSANNAIANKAGSAKATKSENTQNQNTQNPSQANDKKGADLKKEYEIKDPDLAKNPTLSAKLKGAKDKKATGKNNKPKKAPPEPSLNVRMRIKGPLKPRIGPGKLPGRLGGLRADKHIDQLEALKEALNALPANEDPNLITHYSKKLLQDGSSMFPKGKSLAQLLGFDESIAQLDRDSIMTLLASKLNEEGLSEEMKTLLTEALLQLTQNEAGMLKPLTLLFLPFPLPYLYLDIDEEFIEDEEDFFKDEEEASSDEDEGSDDSEKSPEDEGFIDADIQAAISIKTVNFGKMHLKLRHNSETNKMQLSIKADNNAGELAIALEANLEETLLHESNKLLFDEMRNWHDNVLRITESRTLQIASEGKLNPVFLKACNNLLETIYENDEEQIDDVMSAKYKVL